MSFSHDRRGQSVVVGTVILFGFLILALSIYQVQFVPAENSEIEFEHSQEVEGDFQDLRNALLSSGTTGEARSTSIRLGTRYPQRTFFLNPPPASGSLETTAEENLTISDARVGDGVHENVQEFWNDTGFNFDTRSIRYAPNYNEYRGAPELVYENSLVVAEFGDRALPRSDQTILRNERLSLTVLSGELSESGVEARSVDSETVSRGPTRIPVTGEGEQNFNVSLPSAVSNTEDLVDRLERLNISAEAVTANDDQIDITLNGSQTYRLALAEVSVDGSGETEPAYIVPVGGENVTSGQSVGVEVRDKYNNPVGGTTVEIGDNEFTTGANGRVFTDLDSSGVTEANINDGREQYEVVEFTVSEGSDDGGPTPQLVAPNEAVAFDGPGTDDVTGGFQLDVENQHSGPIRITDVTVIPDENQLNGLSDDAPDSGPGRSELYVESNTGDVGDKNVLLITGEQYTFVPNSGLTLNLQEGPPERAYDTSNGEYFDANTEFAGNEVDLDPGQNAAITLAEFYEIDFEDDTAAVADVAGERFSVTVGYKKDGERLTRQFVTTVTGDPVGSVTVQDTIRSDDNEFEVTTSDYLNTEVPVLVVENTRTAGEEEVERDADSEGTFTIAAGDVGGLEENDEIVATLFESDARENELDSDTTAVIGENQPTFTTLELEAGGPGGQPFINQMSYTYDLDMYDENGDILFEFVGDDGVEMPCFAA